jgi:hypothetical protein
MSTDRVSDREGLIARIRQIRQIRRPAGGGRPSTNASDPQPDGSDSQPDGLRALEVRVAHLEQLLQGLQDSVHRESERHAKLIAELQGQIQPGMMGASLAEDARNRGL